MLRMLRGHRSHIVLVAKQITGTNLWTLQIQTVAVCAGRRRIGAVFIAVLYWASGQAGGSASVIVGAIKDRQDKCFILPGV